MRDADGLTFAFYCRLGEDRLHGHQSHLLADEAGEGRIFKCHCYAGLERSGVEG